MQVYLKVKIKSLAAEAAIIRKEESKLPRERDIAPEQRSDPAKQALWARRTSLRIHRTGEVRDEARAALLAYGFLRGRRYRQMEAYTREVPRSKIVDRVLDLTLKYSGVGRSKAKRDEVWDKLKPWFDEPEVRLEKAA